MVEVRDWDGPLSHAFDGTIRNQTDFRLTLVGSGVRNAGGGSGDPRFEKPKPPAVIEPMSSATFRAFASGGYDMAGEVDYTLEGAEAGESVRFTFEVAFSVISRGGNSSTTRGSFPSRLNSTHYLDGARAVKSANTWIFGAFIAP